jgi:hypothetical protein
MPADLVAAALGVGAGGAPAVLPPPDHTPGEARGAAARILARPEYRWASGESLHERVLGWVGDRFADLFGPLGFGSGGGPVVVGWLVLAGLCALVAYLVYRARGGWGRSVRRPAAAGGGRVALREGEAAVDWSSEAERAEREGRWRDALRARYRLLVGELARCGLVGDLTGRTTGELVADVRAAAPAAGPSFAAATDVFERTWYGGVAVGPVERDRLVALASEVLGAAGARAGAGRA